nr:hypothetical protein [Tanacetum cinerariifolium]
MVCLDSINQAWEILDQITRRAIGAYSHRLGLGLEERQLDEMNMMKVDNLYYGRKSLVKIDNNYARFTHPPSYATLLLEDIHIKNTNSCAATTRLWRRLLISIPTRACCYQMTWKNLAKMGRTVTKEMVTESGTVVNDVSIDKQDSWELNSAARQHKVKGFREFKRDFMDYPRKGIRRGR